LTVLNDSKYGFDVRDGVMRVTMLRSPAYAHHDRARYDSSLPYSIMDQGLHVMKIRLAPHEGAWNTRNPARKAWELNAPAFAHVESAHAGALGPETTFLSVDADNVLLSVLKRSEEGGALIIRGYEARGVDVETTLRLPHWGKTWPVAFKAHEIKTLRVNPADWSIAETSLLE
jgi:alpha-mannosidase